MNTKQIAQLIQIDETSYTPKYLQVAYAFISQFDNGKIRAGESIPSINALSKVLGISRDTAEKAYRHLKNLEVIEGVARKGYFMKAADLPRPFKLLLLPAKLSAHKKAILDALLAALQENAITEFSVYNNDFSVFKKLIADKDGCKPCVIVPLFT